MGISLALTVLTYNIFAYLRTGKLPNWIEIVELQKLFVVLGFYMAPMRNFDLWNIVMLIYVVVLFSCLVALIKKRVTDEHRYYFFISLLGIGIFSYYQGRSLVSNLFILIYPAIILAAFLLHDISGKYRINKNNLKYVFKNNLFRYDFIKMFFLSIILVYGIVAFFSKLPDLYKWVKYNIKEVATANQTPYFSETIDFIKENKKGNETVIFSYYNDYLYCLTGTYSGLPFCSTIEAVTTLQWERIKEVIKSKKIKQIFYGINSMPKKFDLVIFTELSENYKKVKQTADGSMMLYEAK